MIRILLADDHILVRAGLKQLLEEDPEFQVVAEASNGREAIDEFCSIFPDVTILDISMPVLDGLDACKQIKTSYPQAKILILTIHPEEQYAVRLLKAGALGYITKRASPIKLHEAVRSVFEGKMYLSEEIKDMILSKLLYLGKHIDQLELLSDRELQVLCLLSQSHKMKEIAARLNLSVKTIETYRSRLLTKLNLRNNADLVVFARDHGLL